VTSILKSTIKKERLNQMASLKEERKEEKKGKKEKRNLNKARKE